VIGGFPILVSCVVYGVCSRRTEFRHRSLLLACVMFSMLPCLLCVANSRMTLPLLAMLLPAAGVGLDRLVERRAWPRGLILLGLTAAGLWALNPHMPQGALGAWRQASACYVPVTRFIEHHLSRWNIAATDRIALRCAGGQTPGPVQLTIPNGPYFFVPSIGQSLTWPDLRPGEERDFTVRTLCTPQEPPTVQITLVQTGRSARIQPTQRDAWRRWRPTGLPGIEYFWAGSAGLLDVELRRLLEYQPRDTTARRRPPTASITPRAAEPNE
jgi:hypothetical protein